MRLATRITG